MARLLPVLSFTLRWTTADSTSHQNQSDALNVSRDYAPRAVHEKGHVTLVRLWMGSAMERRVPCSSSSEPECSPEREGHSMPLRAAETAGLRRGTRRGGIEGSSGSCRPPPFRITCPDETETSQATFAAGGRLSLAGKGSFAAVHRVPGRGNTGLGRLRSTREGDARERLHNARPWNVGFGVCETRP